MENICIAIIGDKEGIEEAYACVKYKEIVTRMILWSDEVLADLNDDSFCFNEEWIIIVAFRYQIYFNDDVLNLVRKISNVRIQSPDSLCRKIQDVSISSQVSRLWQMK